MNESNILKSGDLVVYSKNQCLYEIKAIYNDMAQLEPKTNLQDDHWAPYKQVKLKFLRVAHANEIRAKKRLTSVKIDSTHVDVFERVISILRAIHATPVATVSEVRNLVFQSVTKRSVQRYLKGLEDAGYLERKQSGRGFEDRFFLTDKTKQLFKVAL